MRLCKGQVQVVGYSVEKAACCRLVSMVAVQAYSCYIVHFTQRPFMWFLLGSSNNVLKHFFSLVDADAFKHAQDDRTQRGLQLL